MMYTTFDRQRNVWPPSLSDLVTSLQNDLRPRRKRIPHVSWLKGRHVLLQITYNSLQLQSIRNALIDRRLDASTDGAWRPVARVHDAARLVSTRPGTIRSSIQASCMRGVVRHGGASHRSSGWPWRRRGRRAMAPRARAIVIDGFTKFTTRKRRRSGRRERLTHKRRLIKFKPTVNQRATINGRATRPNSRVNPRINENKQIMLMLPVRGTRVATARRSLETQGPEVAFNKPRSEIFRPKLRTLRTLNHNTATVLNEQVDESNDISDSAQMFVGVNVVLDVVKPGKLLYQGVSHKNFFDCTKGFSAPVQGI